MKLLRHRGLNFVQRIAIVLATDSLKSFLARVTLQLLDGRIKQQY